jgi:SH3 domain-containing YSC84-like protein 1
MTIERQPNRPLANRPLAHTRPRVRLAFRLAGLASLMVLATTGSADDPGKAKEIVEKAAMTAETVAADPKLDPSWREIFREAKGFLIYPEILKAGFILGGAGGSGVLVARDEKNGKWTGPAFYTIGEASFGFQAGVAAEEVVVVVRTERGLTRLLSSGAKLGADLSVAAGPVGGGVGAGNITADLVVLARSKGLYGGMSVEGAVVAVRDALNQAYYGKAVTPTDILIRGGAENPHAARLVAAVDKLAGKK